MTKLINALTYNNRFANNKITAEQIGENDFSLWKSLIEDLREESYKVYALCENNGMKVEDDTVDKTGIYNAMRFILTAIGEVNGHKLYANETTAILMAGYAGKRGTKLSTELDFVCSTLKSRTTELKKYKELNVNDEDHKKARIEAMEKDIADLEKQKADLIAKPDNKTKEPTRQLEGTFRLNVEQYLARVINEQNAKSWEELEAEDKARKEARKAAANARKKAKAEAK